MKPMISYLDPAVMLDLAEKEMEPIPRERLFNKPQYQKLTERWCAGMFALGYSKFVSPCEVAVNEVSYREDVDIFIRSANRIWEFQLAEVQDTSRKRGLEYKRLASGAAQIKGWEPARGTRECPLWLASAVRKKKEKCYANSSELNLLLYANFPAIQLEYSTLVQELTSFSVDFASLWILTSDHLCSVFSHSALGQVSGWGSIRNIEHYFT